MYICLKAYYLCKNVCTYHTSEIRGKYMLAGKILQNWNMKQSCSFFNLCYFVFMQQFFLYFPRQFHKGQTSFFKECYLYIPNYLVFQIESMYLLLLSIYLFMNVDMKSNPKLFPLFTKKRMIILVADGYSRYSRPMILMLIDYLLYTSLRPLFVFTTSQVRNKNNN